MGGCWQYVNGSTREVWLSEAGGLAFGHSVTTKGRQPSAFEDMRIEPRDGEFVFSASPNGRSPVEFVSISVTDSSVIFENAAHDFPQRISYERHRNELIASISDIAKTQVVLFPMRPCGS